MKESKIKIICYGLGLGFERFIKHTKEDQVEIVGVIDKNAVKSIFASKFPVITLEQIKKYLFDYVVICSPNYRDEMAQALLKAGVPREKIIAIYDCVTLDYSYQNIEVMKQISSDTFLPHRILGEELPLQEDDGSDYIRKLTLSRIAKKISENGIKGSCAELGVWRGVFARVINEFFPDRDLYLFDTFEGFDERDLNIEAGLNGFQVRANFMATIQDTSVEAVLKKMLFPQKCIIRKGYFPESTEGLPADIHFAFVNIDVDLYQPTLSGLEFFYPRMPKNGVIMIHDYSRNYPGVLKAVDEFSAKHSLFPVPLPDAYSSALIVHP